MEQVIMMAKHTTIKLEEVLTTRTRSQVYQPIESMFQKVYIPLAIWNEMTPLNHLDNEDLVQCQALCDAKEECNMFHIQASKGRVSKNVSQTFSFF